ncbi:MAG: hypothetical protein MR209_03720 [Veillonellaceae bacterium]|nr:hypothetical protein [Veillonellaceae bacterium]
MKRIGISVAALLLGGMLTVGAYNAYAPNSFDEVERNTAAYRAVAVWVADGRVPGYTSEDLAREHLSRYEFARVIVAALNDAELVATADAAEVAAVRKGYARELEALGYGERKKAKPFTIEGDVRLRHTDDGESRNDARIRIGAKYTIGADDTEDTETK